MANGKIRFGKQSGGQLALVFPDGVDNTDLVLPESGTLVSVVATVTDNAIVRFDGTTGKVQTSFVIINDNGSLLVGTDVDNGIDKLQVNGNISNTGNINTGGSQYNLWTNAPIYEIVNRGDVAKTFQWYVGANGSAPVASLTTSGVWTNASDKRNKTNIKDIPYGLSTVMSLSPKEYDLKSDGAHAIGFIAQDVKEIIPELVFEEKEGAFLTLDYASMVTVLVKAMQEQQAQIEELRLSIEGK